MIVGLEGGMGNQMFQLAFGKSVAKKRGEEVFFTSHRLNHDPNGRKYALDGFQAEVKIAEKEEFPIVHDTWFYNPGVYTEGNSFIGHWQTEKYFDAPLVRSELKLRNEPSEKSLWMADKILSGPSAFLHVRRTDYLDPKCVAYHGVPSMDYYQRAISHIEASVPDVEFFVFSDDPFWCQDAFPRFTVVHCNQGRAHEDIWLMSLCNHAVICNSSFGWWGAWLGDTQKDRIVIAPKKWFVAGPNSSDVIPGGWLKFDN